MPRRKRPVDKRALRLKRLRRALARDRRGITMPQPEPAGPLTYTLPAVAGFLGVTHRRVLALVRDGRLPPPSLIVAGEPRWLARSIEPHLKRLGARSLEEMVRSDARQRSADAQREIAARKRARASAES